MFQLKHCFLSLVDRDSVIQYVLTQRDIVENFTVLGLGESLFIQHVKVVVLGHNIWATIMPLGCRDAPSVRANWVGLIDISDKATVIITTSNS